MCFAILPNNEVVSYFSNSFAITPETLYLMEYINDLKGQADYETLKFNSDMEAYEAENEDFRTVLCDIESLLQQYEYGLERGSEAFSRKRVFRLFEEIHRLIGEVI